MLSPCPSRIGLSPPDTPRDPQPYRVPASTGLLPAITATKHALGKHSCHRRLRQRRVGTNSQLPQGPAYPSLHSQESSVGDSMNHARTCATA